MRTSRLGAGGNDIRHVLRARDAARDSVTCGAGSGVAYVDRLDRVCGCEIVHRG